MNSIDDGERRQPVIGITSRKGSAEWVKRWTNNYLERVQGSGAFPVILAPDSSARLPNGRQWDPDDQGRLPDDLLDHLDGLILSGGGDVDPSYFGQALAGADPHSIDRKRDELELNLARTALSKDMPLFAICRGCQVLNVAAGGAMVQDFPGHSSPKVNPSYHDVVFAPESRLRAIAGVGTLAVNTYHHQGVDQATLAPLFRPAATALPDTWLIEAFESPTHEWVVGVQWHPERLSELPESHGRLWASFFQVVSRRSESRQVGPGPATDHRSS